MLVSTAEVFAPQRIQPGDSGLKHYLTNCSDFPKIGRFRIVAEGCGFYRCQWMTFWTSSLEEDSEEEEEEQEASTSSG